MQHHLVEELCDGLFYCKSKGTFVYDPFQFRIRGACIAVPFGVMSIDAFVRMHENWHLYPCPRWFICSCMHPCHAGLLLQTVLNV